MATCTCEAGDIYEQQYLDDNRHFPDCPVWKQIQAYRYVPTPTTPKPRKGLSDISLWLAISMILLLSFTVWDQGRVITQQRDLIVQMVSTNPACTEPITK